MADDERAYYEPEAGFVRPEACIAAQLELAAAVGEALAALSMDEAPRVDLAPFAWRRLLG